MSEKSVKITLTFDAIIDIEDDQSINDRVSWIINDNIIIENSETFLQFSSIKIKSHLLLNYSDDVRIILKLYLNGLMVTDDDVDNILSIMNKTKEDLISKEKDEDNDLVLEIDVTGSEFEESLDAIKDYRSDEEDRRGENFLLHYTWEKIPNL